jgi:Spy/CpxP family protein refolding chaperone
MKKVIVFVMMLAIFVSAGVAEAQFYGRGLGLGPGPYLGCPRFWGTSPYGAGTGYLGTSPYGAGTGYWDPGSSYPLNLTSEQAQKMQALRESFFQETAVLRNELINKGIEMRQLWLEPNPDQEKILAKQKEINALSAQLDEKATQNYLGMSVILPPEQQAQLSNLRGWGWGGLGWGGYGRGWGGYGRGWGWGYGPRCGPGWGYGPRW